VATVKNLMRIERMENQNKFLVRNRIAKKIKKYMNHHNVKMEFVKN
jgi:hypothetical protein